MRLPRLFAPPAESEAAHRLYLALVEQSRRPAFYRDWQVPDTLDGRFEMMALHGFLLLHRLKSEGEAARPLAQALFDTIFTDLDGQVRELGVGDLGVGKRVKAMASAFYGRIQFYEEGLSAPASLPEALERNLYGTAEVSPATLAAMAAYLRAQVEGLAAQPFTALAAGDVSFAPPPEPGAGR